MGKSHAPLTSAVPLDDEDIDGDAAETTDAADLADTAQDTQTASDTDASEAPGEAQDTDDEAGTAADADVSGAEGEAEAAALAAIANEEGEGEGEDAEGNPNGIPLTRFREVNERRKNVEAENQQLRELLMRVTPKGEGAAGADPAAAVEVAKPRDFDAEFTALQQTYDAGDMEDDEYERKKRTLGREEGKAAAMEEIKPLVTRLEAEERRITDERVQKYMTAEATKAYVKYPFLNIASKDKNDEAIQAVLTQRNELIARGIDPAKSLRLAVAAIAPDYGEASTGAATGDKVAAARRKQAREAIGETMVQQPSSLAGVGVSGKVSVKPQIGASVKDHDKWERIPEADRDKVMNG